MDFVRLERLERLGALNGLQAGIPSYGSRRGR